MLLCLFTACNDEQDKIGWEPAVAAPLAQLSVDFNGSFELDEYAKAFFPLIAQSQQNKILYEALKGEANQNTWQSTEGLDDSIKKRLPRYLQANIDTFLYLSWREREIPDFMAATLVMDLFDHLEKNGSIVAINKLTYYVLTSRNMPPDYADTIRSSLYRMPMNVNENISLDMAALLERTENLHWLKLQLSISTRLQASARLQVYLRDSTGYVYDSLFREGGGRFEGQMPFANNVLGEYRQRVICDYPTPDLAKSTFNRLHSVYMTVKSDSLCLDTSLVWLKDLYNRKLHAAVGIMFKANMDDLIEE